MLHLKGLTELRKLEIWSNDISIAGLSQLKGLTKLEDLKVKGLKLTDAELERLQQILPKCRIRH